MTVSFRLPGQQLRLASHARLPKLRMEQSRRNQNIGFYFIGRYNERKWRAVLERKLTHRHQIKENIRTARQLLFVLVTAFVGSGHFYSVILYIRITSDKSIITIVLVPIFALVSIKVLFLFTNYSNLHPHFERGHFSC
uniref:7TM_GPCR_Srx domain-containing protein n=1 Tax=Steinernema glaseri TaxID=37863 RepID=A0A1I8AUM1_9BILA